MTRGQFLYRYAYGDDWFAPTWSDPLDRQDHWSPDLQARAFAAADDEELQAVYEEQLADYQSQVEYAYDMEEARRAQEAELERQAALCDWHNGRRW